MSSDEGARVPTQEITPPLLDHTSNPAVPSPTPLASLGTLSTLPCELRDEIYRNVCKQDDPYLFNDYGRMIQSEDHELSCCQKWEIENLSLLRVSNLIRKEFFSVLCSEGDIEISRHSDKIRGNEIPFNKDIVNIRFGLYLILQSGVHCMGIDRSLPVRHSRLSAMKGGPILFFTGTSVIWIKCVVQFSWCTPKSSLILESPLMDAMAQLTGFEVVELAFCTDADSWLEFGTPWDVKEKFRNLKTCPGFDTVVLRKSKALEPTLGAYTTGGRSNRLQY